MDEKPLISVLTAAYNGADHINNQVECVLNQSFKNWEHLVIDDGSTDSGRTFEKLNSYNHLRISTKENSGQYDTQNHLLRQARGEILTILNQDDAYIDTQVLEDVWKRFQADDKPDVVYGDIRFMDKNGVMLPHRYAYEGPRSTFLLDNVSCVYHIALFFKRSLFEKNNLYFNPEFKMAGDWEWNLRLFKTAERMVHIGRPLALFRVHGNQKTKSIGECGFKPEIERICRDHGIPRWLNKYLRWYTSAKTRVKSWFYIVKLKGISGVFSYLKDRKPKQP